MPELRQNFFTKEWVIIATERAKKPEELATNRPAQAVPAYVESCPFCPGNEIHSPIELMRHPVNAAEPWVVRVIPNKFAALSSELQPTRNLQHLRRRVEGFGFHEVLIEAPDHSSCIAIMSETHVANILEIYKKRYNALSADRRITTSRFSRTMARERVPASRTRTHSSSPRPSSPARCAIGCTKPCATTTTRASACTATWSNAKSKTKHAS
jgi:galactose-1-phosphate uridylyltransferase